MTLEALPLYASGTLKKFSGTLPPLIGAQFWQCSREQKKSVYPGIATGRWEVIEDSPCAQSSGKEPDLIASISCALTCVLTVAGKAAKVFKLTFVAG